MVEYVKRGLTVFGAIALLALAVIGAVTLLADAPWERDHEQKLPKVRSPDVNAAGKTARF